MRGRSACSIRIRWFEQALPSAGVSPFQRLLPFLAAYSLALDVALKGPPELIGDTVADLVTRFLPL